MIEPEVAFNEIEENMQLAQDFIQYCIQWALDNCQDDLNFLNDMYDKELIERLKFVVENDFVRLTYTEGVKILEQAVANGHKFEYRVGWGTDLQSQHERYLVEQHFKKPVILTDYPQEIKAFYMKLSDDGKTVRAMDVLFPKIGEIIGGSQREERYDLLAERMAAAGLNLEEYSWYLDLRRFGSARDLLLEPRHADHEELIQVGGEDGQELGPLDQRDAVPVPGEIQDAVVELKPGDLAIQVAVRG